MRRGKGASEFAQIVLVPLLILVLLLPLAHAQVQDSDGDGVIDSSDVCPATNPDEGLPIIMQNREFLGCSCSQIYDKIGEYCYDVFCSTGRPFSAVERAYSSREMGCSEDYCINSTLYDFPQNHEILCTNGKEEKFSCNATVTENSAACMNGSVAQYAAPENSVIATSNITLLDDYEKLQNRAYKTSQNLEIKTGLGISGENTFIAQSEKTMNSIVIEKTLKTESKLVGSTEKTISIKTIKITPSRHKHFRKLYIFEELPRGAKVGINEVIPGMKVVYQDETSPVLLVWELEKVTKPVEITYQVNAPLQGDSNTLLIAREVKNGFWKLMILPAIFIIIVVWVFIRTSQKAIPKRKRIFKE